MEDGLSLPLAYRHPMIDLGTLADLLEHGHGLAAYCSWCSRWSELPLAELVDQV